MIWIIGGYAERIDNADELLESFLEGFQDENTQVKCLDMGILRKCVPINIHINKPQPISSKECIAYWGATFD